MLTMTTNKAYCESATEKYVARCGNLNAREYKLSIAGLFLCSLFGGLYGAPTGGRPLAGISTSVQSASLCVETIGGSSQICKRTSPCHRFTSYTFYSAFQSATLSILDIAYTSLSETLTSLRKVWRCAMSHTKPWIDVRRFHRLHRGAWKHREYEYPFVFENLSGGHRLPHVGMHFASRTALRQSAKGWRVI